MRNVVATVVFAAMAMVGGNAAAIKISSGTNGGWIISCGGKPVGSCSSNYSASQCEAAANERGMCPIAGGVKITKNTGRGGALRDKDSAKPTDKPKKATTTGTSTGVIKPIMITDENQPVKKKKKVK